MGRRVAPVAQTTVSLGLALGAGGAMGYANVGALQALHEADIPVHCLAGASMGAVVGCLAALGMDPYEIENALRKTMTAETMNVAISPSGTSSAPLVERVFRDLTGDATFADLVMPMSVMAADLDNGMPVTIDQGPLWMALIPAVAFTGAYTPYRDHAHFTGRRLVDGLALTPVPVEAVRALGAGVTVAINVMNRDRLRTWPNTDHEPPAPADKDGAVATMLEVLELTQIEASARNAERADVLVTPRFGPGSWRDWHMAELFVQAGRDAMEQRLSATRGALHGWGDAFLARSVRGLAADEPLVSGRMG